MLAIRKIKKSKVYMSMILVLIFCSFLSITVFASSYQSSGNFYVSMTSDWRYFDGNNITLETYATSVNTNYTITYFTATLQRKTWYGWTTIGSAQFPKEGHASRTWTNVGPGDYRFYYSRANDGGLQMITTAYIYN